MLQLDQLKTKADALRRQLAEVDKLTGKNSERERDADRKRQGRAADRDLQLHAPVDLDRRRACMEDPQLFMSTYFGWIFWQPFIPSREAMIQRIVHAARYAGSYAVAELRGGGKSKTALFTTFWLDLRRELRLPLIVGKNQRGAENELSNLKQAIVESPAFSDDFPEICIPIIALEGWASTARKQTVHGHRTNIGWERDCLFLPTIPDEVLRLVPGWPADEPSTACGQGLAVVGIDGKIRGFDRRNIRPDMAIIDDIDDRESARSEPQTQDHRDAIDKDIGGLAGSGKRISRVMLCTTINDTCVAAVYTKLPSWRGQRFKAIVTMPERKDLWEEYIALRRERKEDDPDARAAHRLYLANREEMDRGAEVGNPYDYVQDEALDGEPLEVSALQHYYNWIADNNWEAFLCEYQNDPPDSKNSAGLLMLTASHIQHGRLSGLDRWRYPLDTVCITIGGDVQKLGLHWVAIAWNERGAGTIIAYDFFEFMTVGKKVGDCELLILEGLLDWRDRMAAVPFCGQSNDVYPNGEPRFADISLIDMGWKDESWTTQPVEIFCRQSGPNFIPAKGESPYHKKKPSQTIVAGDNWYAELSKDGLWRVTMNTGHWKLKVHEGFLVDEGEPGSLLIHDQPKIDGRTHRTAHMSFSNHIVSERWDALKKKWTEPTKANHYLDGSYMSIVGRSMRGIDVFDVPLVITPPPPQVALPTPSVQHVPNHYSRNRW